MSPSSARVKVGLLSRLDDCLRHTKCASKSTYGFPLSGSSPAVASCRAMTLRRALWSIPLLALAACGSVPSRVPDTPAASVALQVVPAEALNADVSQQTDWRHHLCCRLCGVCATNDVVLERRQSESSFARNAPLQPTAICFVTPKSTCLNRATSAPTTTLGASCWSARIQQSPVSWQQQTCRTPRPYSH